MLPLELIRRDPERVRRAAQLKGEPAPIDEILELDEKWRSLLHSAETVKRQLDDLLLRVPNLFHESVPVGEGEQDNVVLRDWGSKVELGFAARTHYDLGEALGIMDFERAARVAGSRFAFLMGEGAR